MHIILDCSMPRAASPSSAYTVSSSESDDYAPSASPPPAKKRKVASKPVRRASTAGGISKSQGRASAPGVVDLDDAAGPCVIRPHGVAYHATDKVQGVQEALLSWFEDVRCASPPRGPLPFFGAFSAVRRGYGPYTGDCTLMTREKRGMPWRKPYDDSLSVEEKGQRAYEVSPLSKSGSSRDHGASVIPVA